MKKKVLALFLACTLAVGAFSGCGAKQTKSDQEAADEVAKLIDAIYVQQWTEETDKQCEAAKKAWDALTKEQKALVKGEYADPDYFGRDTGDASLDDALNSDEIGENEILVVSFGTSFNDSRTQDIGGIEKAIKEAKPDWSVRRAFTSQIIINHVQARDGEKIDNMDQALERAVNNGVKNLLIQPTHLMHGAEYDELMESVANYQDKFETIRVAEPLLGQVGEDATVINEDKKNVAKAVVEESLKDAEMDSIEAAVEKETAFVLMGHGTSHTAKVTYDQMKTQMKELEYDNVFVGTVEGEPEGTSCEDVIEGVKEAGYKNVILRPLMVVAGDHANNDMAGDEEDSWKSMFEAAKCFDTVKAQIEGLGSIETIQDIYVQHVEEALKAEPMKFGSTSSEVKDGIYSAKFTTDSPMFHVNEAYDGRGTLTVKDGKMMLHISLTSKRIVNLFLGTAKDAQKAGAKILQPTVDTVEYSDGTTEEVNAFDIPVEKLDEEFDLALLGEKGTWYDHKVSVSDPQKKKTANLTMEGGSGKASIDSPVEIIEKDDKIYAKLVWSSSNYDYMLVEGEKYLNEAAQGEKSTFIIPIEGVPCDMHVVGDTTAMGTPHEIEYTLHFETEE